MPDTLSHSHEESGFAAEATPVTPELTAELYPGTELSLAAEKARQVEWEATGECPGPTVIGSLQLDPQSVEHLREHVTSEYTLFRGDKIFSQDDEVAESAKGSEKIPLPDAGSREILNAAYQAFKALILQDIARSKVGLTSKVTQDISFGMFHGDDDPHFDYDDYDRVRYAVTLIGPSTPFYKGSDFGKDYFDGGGDLADNASIPPEVTLEPTPTCAVLRFWNQCDPHNVPQLAEPVFRVFTDAYVRFYEDDSNS